MSKVLTGDRRLLLGSVSDTLPKMESAKQFSAIDYARARRKYRPGKIRVLLVAESPPSSGGFFYFPTTIGKDHLFRETMKALRLWPLSRPMIQGVDKRPLLRQFQSKGFFLVDTSPLPINNLSDSERRTAIVRNSTRVAATARDLDTHKVAIIKTTVYGPVRDALERIGLGDKILNSGPMPFPSHGNQRKYRSLLRNIIKKVGT